MSANTRLKVTTSTSNNAVTTIFNSTYGLRLATSATVVGSLRGRYAGHRVEGSVTTGNQDVTLRLDGLENGAWVTGISSTTVSAGNTQPFGFLSRHPDFRVVIVNGATGPSTLVAEAYLVKGDRA